MHVLLGFRVVGKKPGADPRYDLRLNKLSGTLQLLGPLLVGFGLFKLFGAMS